MKTKYTMNMKELHSGKLMQINAGTELKIKRKIIHGYLVLYTKGTKYCYLECTDEQYKNLVE